MRLQVNQSFMCVINAAMPFNNTGLVVSTGEEYEFKAKGKWKDLLIECEASGYKNFYMSIFKRLKRSRDNNWFALIGSIDKTDYFLLGKQINKRFEISGTLYCFANDAERFYWNNSGSVELTIKRLK
jgi:hypothetical protein